MKKKKIVALIIAVAVIIPIIFVYSTIEEEEKNKIPIVTVSYPREGSTLSKIVIISGTASDPDGDDNLIEIEILIDDERYLIDGNSKWSYEWNTYDLDDGIYNFYIRAWDGVDYSETEEIKVRVQNPVIVENEEHKWAIFVIASNFPDDNDSKLGNGGLYFAENMAEYFVRNYDYSTENIIILFDDGWIREDNGYGKPIYTLQERKRKYDFTYAGAFKGNVKLSIDYVINEANNFDDSEVFIWISSHGYGDSSKECFGGKLLERSAVFLWDDILTDDELGDMLSSLKSEKTCVIVDACYSGGFADKSIFNLPEFFTLKSGIPNPGRIVIAGASKFRLGYASTTKGPLFSQLWFYGIESGKADGFISGILNIGRPTRLKFFKDGKVSVEEAFFYARYNIRKNPDLTDYKKMEPQINDQYPNRGFLRSMKGMVLGE